MAQSKCAKCDSTNFEVMPAKPQGSNFEIMFIQCSECGAVIGALEANNVNTRLKQIISILGQIDQKIIALRFR